MKKWPRKIKQFIITNWSKIAAFSIFFAFFFYALDALARAGGGHSYSSGGSSHSSSSSGSYSSSSDGDRLLAELIARLLIELLFEYPEVGVPLLIIVIIAYIFRKPLKKLLKALGIISSMNQAQKVDYLSAAAKSASKHRRNLTTIKSDDPNFSEPLFFDFAQLLFVRTLRALNNKDELKVVEPYIRPEALKMMNKNLLAGGKELKDVVIGSFAMKSAQKDTNKSVTKINVVLEADYTWKGMAIVEQRYYVNCSLTFERKFGVLSKGPAEITALGCPNCGATAGITPAGLCAHCGSAVNSGEYQWVVSSFNMNKQVLIPLKPGSEHVEEEGTDYPTITDEYLAADLAELTSRHPGFDLAHLEERVKKAFLTIQEAWSSQSWELARPYETDSIFEVHRFWIENYKRAGRRSICENVNVSKIELVKIATDRYYEAATFRIHASMLDYVVDSRWNVISGSKTKPRPFTEYWTFIRAKDFSEKAYNSEECPSCGAPIKLNQSGKCEYCGTVVTGGNFDWVLSRIEQDESYFG